MVWYQTIAICWNHTIGMKLNKWSMETWRHGDMENGDLETCRHGDMKTDTWIHGNMDTWIHGYMETWRHEDMKKYKLWGHFCFFNFKSWRNKSVLRIFIFPLKSVFLQHNYFLENSSKTISAKLGVWVIFICLLICWYLNFIFLWNVTRIQWLYGWKPQI